MGRAAVLTAFLLATLILTLVNLGDAGVSRGGDEWKQVTVIYQSDVKGKIEPCG